MTKDEAIRLAGTKFWEDLSDIQIARFWFAHACPIMCLPFDVLHRATEMALGRGVYTHEFMNCERLKAELFHGTPAPTWDEIVAMIPADKLVAIVPPEAV